MIKLETLRIQEFRGIREHTLNFSQKNHAICGPNGTGKSGVVDAIEFALTGDISRLGGTGRSDLSVKAHAPHVNVKDTPEKAVVTLKVYVPALKKSITITRNVKDSSKPKLDPDTPETREVLATLESHREVVLSRREIIRYVVVAPGERAKEVQILLRLDDVEKVRTKLEKIANSEEAASEALARSERVAGDELARIAGIAVPRTDLLLKAVNEKRKSAGVPELALLDPLVPVNDGLAALGTVVTPTGVAKAQASEDLKKLGELLQLLGEWASSNLGQRVVKLLIDLAANEDLLRDAERVSFYEAGLKFADAAECPFCNKQWALEDLRSHVQSKLDRLVAAVSARKNIVGHLGSLLELIDHLRTVVIEVGKTGKLLTPPIDLQPLRDFVKKLDLIRGRCEALLPIADTQTAIQDLNELGASIQTTTVQVAAAVAALPDPSLVDAARDYLSACQHKLESLRTAKQSAERGKLRAVLADGSRTAFGKASKKVLDGVYDSVRDEFVRLYRLINKEDEGGFAARLEPLDAKLSFGVDFYGKGQYPPGAYHSEGHQDGMGLCLYLALMRYLFKGQFALAVLDDVVMSIDTGHRRHVCSVLRNEFRDTQFILTTHDQIWLEYMKSEGLIGHSGDATHFKTWNVETGPTTWDDRDTFERVRGEIAAGNTREAASILRHDLEYFAAELCTRTKANVVYQANGRHDLGMLMDPVVSRLKDLLKKARSAAESWAQDDVVKKANELLEKLVAAHQRTQMESWQANALIHYNNWENLEAKELEPVAAAFEALLSVAQCPDCHSLLAVTYKGFEEQDLRCTCPKTNWNLVKQMPK